MTQNFAHIVRGSGPGLLLAHGGGGSIENNFGSIIDDLAETHTVVGPDYPGSGATPRSERPLVLDEVADALVDTAVAAGVERFVVLGYSLGTAVAVRAATRHPERVTGLILTAGFAYPNNKLRLAIDVWRGLLEAGDRKLIARFLTYAAPGAPQVNSMTAAELSSTVDWLAENLAPGSAEHVGLVDSVDTRADLAGIRVPALVVATTLDWLASPDLSRQLAEGIAGAELTEIEAGHGIGVEARDEWLAAIRTFLIRVT